MDKITEQDLANRGVKGLPDVPGLTTEEMQRKLEEIAREILIPKVNELVEGLNNANRNLSSVESLGLSQTVTINSHTGRSLTFEFETDKARILAFRGVDASNGNIAISSFAVTGDKTVRVDVLNTYSSALTVSVSAYVLVSDF